MNSSVKMDSCSMNAALAPVNTSFGEVERGEVEGQEVIAPQIEGRVPDNAPVLKGYGMGYSAAQWVMKFTKNHPYLCFVCVGLFGALSYGSLGSRNDVSSTGLTDYTNKDLELLHGNFGSLIDFFEDREKSLKSLKDELGYFFVKINKLKFEIKINIEKNDSLIKDGEFVELLGKIISVSESFNEISRSVYELNNIDIKEKIIKDNFMFCASEIQRKSCYERLERVLDDVVYYKGRLASISPFEGRLHSLAEKLEGVRSEVDNYLYDS